MSDDMEIQTDVVDEDAPLSPTMHADFSIESDEPEEAGEEEQDDPVNQRVKELEEREAAIAKREKDLNKGFEEAARKRREAEQMMYSRPPAQGDDDDPLAGVDPEAIKLVEKIVERQVKPFMDLSQLSYTELVESEMESFARGREIDPEELIDVVKENNLLMTAQGPDRSSRQKVYNTAAQIIKAQKEQAIDIDALVEAKVEERLAALKGKKVVAPPRPSRTEPVSSDDTMFNEDWEPTQKIAFWKAKGWLKDE